MIRAILGFLLANLLVVVILVIGQSVATTSGEANAARPSCDSKPSLGYGLTAEAACATR